jgi:thiol-disulfide isomerase/thioredoxin
MRVGGLFALASLSCGLWAQVPATPRHSPEFVLTFNDGTQKLLSSYRGKVVAIEFLHTTCPHCQHASSVFTKLYQEYGPKGFQPLGVAYNDRAKLLVPDFIKTFHVGYPVAYSERDPVLHYLGAPDERVNVPQIVWIDRAGTIRSQTPPVPADDKLYKEEGWRAMIETLLKEPAVTTSRKPVHKPAS